VVEDHHQKEHHMTTETIPAQKPFLKHNILPGVTVATMLVIVIMALSLGLHLYNINSIGDANAYYTAAVKSMLMSWKNFFFVAAEPGGSVTIDKPPLGLWIEAVFAYFLGVSGFSVSLPNILAGVFGIPLLYAMVKKYAGEMAGLISALVMAITPVFVATNRTTPWTVCSSSSCSWRRGRSSKPPSRANSAGCCLAHSSSGWASTSK